jgi:hypothetical protein
MPGTVYKGEARIVLLRKDIFRRSDHLFNALLSPLLVPVVDREYTHQLLLSHFARFLFQVQEADDSRPLARLSSFVFAYGLFDFCQFIPFQLILGSHAKSVSFLSNDYLARCQKT